MAFQIALALLFVAYGEASFDVYAQPSQLNLGLTESSIVNCTFFNNGATNLNTLHTLTISRLNSFNPAYVDIVTIDSTDPEYARLLVSENVKPSGRIYTEDEDDSFLSLRFRFPMGNQAGTYKCMATGLDGIGNNIAIEDYAVVTSSVPTSDALLTKISELDTRAQLTEELHQSELDRLNRKLTIMKDVLFSDTFVYNGNSYYLSRVHFSTDQEATAACSVFGGYLAEIDDQAEFNAIADYFVRTIGTNLAGGVQGVVVSGTDEVREGTWLYQFSGTPLTYTNWFGDEPNDGRRYNCLALWKASNYRMTDFPCLNTDYNALYLCETAH